MGKPDAEELNFWTRNEYDKFIAAVDEKDRYYALFEFLFWTGCRERKDVCIQIKAVIKLVQEKFGISFEDAALCFYRSETY